MYVAVADEKYFYHSFISLHKPVNLDISGFPALFAFLFFTLNLCKSL